MTRVNARGEHVIAVTKRIIPNPDGSTSIEASLSLDGAPVPDRRYAADTVHLDRVGDAIHIMFGQTTINRERLRSLVVIKVYPETIRRFLGTCGTFWPQFQAFIERNKIEKPKLMPLKEEPAQVVALVANVLAAGYTGREAVMDFYHFNALALKKLNESSELAVDPVVRIDLSAAALAALIETLNNLKEELPPEVT